MRKFQNKSKDCTKKVYNILRAVEDGYYVYLLCLEKEVERNKDESCSWGGQDEVRLIQEFNNAINEGINKTIESIINLINETHWKLSNQEIYKLEQQCKETFEKIIMDFEKKFHSIVGEMNRSQNISLTVLKNNVSAKISGQFSEIEFSQKHVKDRNYLATIFLGIASIVVTIIIFLIQLILK
ncbi:MAG: hypothetical protein IJB26_01880 [Clostridia bacterium]|nr:hypothetical protein [Clostridia bacterium]